MITNACDQDVNKEEKPRGKFLEEFRTLVQVRSQIVQKSFSNSTQIVHKYYRIDINNYINELNKKRSLVLKLS